MSNIDITVITPGGDRPWSLDLLRKYLLRQTFPGSIQWLIISDSRNQKPYEQIWLQFVLHTLSDARFQNGALHQLPHDISSLGPRSLAQNLIWGLERAQGNAIFICEDDDWYGKGHLMECFYRLSKPKIGAVGTIWQKYYHLPSLSYRTFKNIGSALCSTAFHRNLIPIMIEAASHCYQHNQKGIDRRFWDSLSLEQKDIFDPKKNQVIGIKGLPGRAGIGIGHQPRGFEQDQDAAILRAWVGDDADIYLTLRSKHNGSGKKEKT